MQHFIRPFRVGGGGFSKAGISFDCLWYRFAAFTVLKTLFPHIIPMRNIFLSLGQISLIQLICRWLCFFIRWPFWFCGRRWITLCIINFPEKTFLNFFNIINREILKITRNKNHLERSISMRYFLIWQEKLHWFYIFINFQVLLNLLHFQYYNTCLHLNTDEDNQ